jgi:hypothetical protein
MTFLPAPDMFVPYSGLPESVSDVSSCTCVSTDTDKGGGLQHEVQECLVMGDRFDEIVRLELRAMTITIEQGAERITIVRGKAESIYAHGLYTHLTDDRIGEDIGRRKQGSVIVKSTPRNGEILTLI